MSYPDKGTKEILEESPCRNSTLQLLQVSFPNVLVHRQNEELAVTALLHESGINQFRHVMRNRSRRKVQTVTKDGTGRLAVNRDPLESREPRRVGQGLRNAPKLIVIHVFRLLDRKREHRIT